MRTADFDYLLPGELIAQSPADKRDKSRLLVLHRKTQTLEHRVFSDLATLLKPSDLLIVNDSKVIPARLRGQRPETGGKVELMLVEETSPNEWWAMVRPGKRLRPGACVQLLSPISGLTTLTATVLGKNAEGHCHLRFQGTEDIRLLLDQLGEIPLPPYILREPGPTPAADAERYQTVYARNHGSVAAPTAGLHFTREILDGLRKQGVEVRSLTLHVGLGTFAPVKADSVENHTMHLERYEVSEEAAASVRRARAEQRRVVAVGTTSVRVLESVAAANAGNVVAGCGSTRIFLYPPTRFQIVDALLTNFHLPQSTLLMLVSAFAAPGETGGRAWILDAYAEAIRQRYRFFSYGDAMFIE